MDELNKVLDTIEELVREANEATCLYVGISSLKELLEEYGRKVDDK